MLPSKIPAFVKRMRDEQLGGLCEDCVQVGSDKLRCRSTLSLQMLMCVLLARDSEAVVHLQFLLQYG